MAGVVLERQEPKLLIKQEWRAPVKTLAEIFKETG